MRHFSKLGIEARCQQLRSRPSEGGVEAARWSRHKTPYSSKDIDPHGVGRFTVHGDDDIHLAAAGKAPWKAQIDLIDAGELGLRSRKKNLGGLASDRCRDRLGIAEPDAGAK